VGRGVRGGRCYLPHLTVRAHQWRPFSLISIGSHVAPRVAAGLRNDPLQHQPQHTQRYVSMEAMHRPVIDRAHTQPIFERAPGLLNALQLLVTQRQICRAQYTQE
jgi:hypothetical protein